MLYSRKYFKILRFCICLYSFVWIKIICHQFFICLLLSVLLFCVFMSLPLVGTLSRFKTQTSESACFRIPYSLHQRWLLPDVTKEENKRVHRSRVFKILRQTSALENKMQLWPLLCCVVRRILWPKNSVIKVHADFCRWLRNFLPSFCIFFH